ncbi:MAG: hypothetical protein ACPG4Q_00950 [Phycisphaeraceae bacterium]
MNKQPACKPGRVTSGTITWRITLDTYVTRQHEDLRPTVDRRHIQVHTPFPPPDPRRP